MVFIAPEPPVTELSEIPEADDPSFMHGSLEPVSARVGAGLMIDNFCDMAHFPFVHAATIGTPESSTFDFTVERRGFGMNVRSRHPFPNREDPGVAAGIRPLLQERILEYRYRVPFSICLRIDYVEAGGTNVLDFYVQPEDDDNCRIYTTVHRNDLDGDEDRHGREHRVRTQDPRRGPRSAGALPRSAAAPRSDGRGAREGRPHDHRAAPHIWPSSWLPPTDD